MESHNWDQDSVEVRVDVPIPAAIKAKDVAYTLTPHALTLGVQGSPPLFDAEKLLDTVKVDDSSGRSRPSPRRALRARHPAQVLPRRSLGVPLQEGRRAPGPHPHPPMLFRRRRGGESVGRIVMGPVRERHAQDVRELPRAVHGREGRRPLGRAAHLQGLQVPPRHPQLHVPGRRLHSRRRHRRRVHLWRKVRRRKLQSEALEARSPVHGQRGAGHQRLAIFPHHHRNPALGRETRGFGEVLEGTTTSSRRWRRSDRHSGKTSADVVIVDCGVL